jgi:Icc protein
LSREEGRFLIAQISDIHCGDQRFDSRLLRFCIDSINGAKPDLTVVAGDLTMNGYREEFEEAERYLSNIEGPKTLIIAGNHDCRNVGYIHFEEIFGPRNSIISFTHSGTCTDKLSELVQVVAVDSNKADINDGEIGSHKYEYIQAQFEEEKSFKIFVLHHHLVHIPGTGRERNIVWDAGDVLQVLRDLKVDLVLCGHKHVPYTWPLSRMYLVTSGTVSTWRTRGNTPPSFNFIEIKEGDIKVDVISSADGSRVSTVYPRWWCEERFSGYDI